MLIGRLEFDLHNPTAALQWLRRAEKLAPRDEETVVALAGVFRDLGQTADAEKYAAKANDIHRKLKEMDALLKAIRENPDAPEPRYEAGVLLLSLGHDKEGYRWLASSLEIDPDFRPAHQALADYHEARGETERARNHRLAAEGKLRANVGR